MADERTREVVMEIMNHHEPTTETISEETETTDELSEEVDQVEEPEQVTEESEEIEEKPASKYEGLTDEQKEATIAELNEKEELTDEDRAFLEAEGYEIEETEEVEEEEKPLTKPKYAEHLESIFGDREFKSNEEYEAAVVEYIDNEREANQALLKILDENPTLLAALRETRENNTPFNVALAMHMEEEEITPKPGDDGYEAYVEAKVLKKQKQEAIAKKADEARQNYENSLKTAERFVKNKGLNEAKTKELYQAVDQTVADITSGNYSEMFLELVLNGLNYKTDVEVAKKQGEVAGANRKITLKKKATAGDGLPKFRGGKETVQEKEKAPSDPFLDILSGINQRVNR